MRNNRSLVVQAPSAAPAVLNVDKPSPSEGEVLVRIHACALNFADLLILEGRYQANPPFPLTPGLEIAGTVEAISATVSNVKVGDRVAAQVDDGGLADYATVPAERLLPLPDEISFETAAAFQIAHGTSHLALVRRARLQAGETLIVLGAAGGVGLTAVEIGKSLGARVIAVARGGDRLKLCSDYGADITIDSGETPDLRAALLELGRAHVLYDTVGGEAGIAAQRALAPEGRHLLIGFAGGTLPELKPNHLLVKNLDVIGVNWNHYIKAAPELVRQTLGDLAGLIVNGQIKPHIGATYTLDDAAAALERLKSRQVAGKIIVTP